MKCFALTGGIASGKSTVAKMILNAGIPVIDADVLARQVVQPGTVGLTQIIQIFGPDYIDEHGELDRTKMATRIFSDPNSKRQLEAITHPLIREKLISELKRYEQAGKEFAVYEAPLIFETGSHKAFDATILVDIPTDIQIERIMKRDSLSKEAALQRIQNQMPREEKIALANYVIDNSHSLEHTANQLKSVRLELTKPPLHY